MNIINVTLNIKQMETYITKKRKNVHLILELYLKDSTGPVARLLGTYPEWNKDVMYISDVSTFPNYTRKGYGTQLIRRALWEARRNGCSYVKLDDFSDGFGTDRNIYVKNGFKYEHDGFPEMILNFKL